MLRKQSHKWYKISIKLAIFRIHALLLETYSLMVNRKDLNMYQQVTAWYVHKAVLRPEGRFLYSVITTGDWQSLNQSLLLPGRLLLVRNTINSYLQADSAMAQWMKQSGPLPTSCMGSGCSPPVLLQLPSNVPGSTAQGRPNRRARAAQGQVPGTQLRPATVLAFVAMRGVNQQMEEIFLSPNF